MKMKIMLPSWMTDPERFWQRVAAGLGILALALFLICCRLHGEITKYQTDMQELSKLNDNQRQFISQIGDGLGQARLERLHGDVRAIRLQSGAAQETGDLGGG